MTTSTSTFWLSITLIFALIISVGLMFYTGKNHDHINLAAASKNMDFFMINASYQEYDTNGHLKSAMAAPVTKHFKEHDELSFNRPDILIYSADSAPWHIQAANGFSHDSNQKVDLWGGVVIHRAADKNNPETNITANQATYYPQKNLVVTNSPVTLTRPDARIQGTGAIADFKKGTVTVLANAKGSYDVTSH